MPASELHHSASTGRTSRWRFGIGRQDFGAGGGADPRALGIDGVEHDQARRMYIAAHGLHQRGEAVLSVLQRLPMNDELWVRLLGAGFVAGVWSTPWLWQPQLNRRLSPLSRIVRAGRHPP